MLDRLQNGVARKSDDVGVAIEDSLGNSDYSMLKLWKVGVLITFVGSEWPASSGLSSSFSTSMSIVAYVINDFDCFGYE